MLADAARDEVGEFGPGPGDNSLPDDTMSRVEQSLPSAGRLSSLVVVGSGLVGTSIALAATAAGIEVALDDQDLAALDGAQHVTGCRRWQDGMPRVDHAVVCVPPHAVASALVRVQRLHVASTYSDVCSVKSRPLLEAEGLGAEMTSFVGGHPMAGRESSGPWNARADLFRGRPWPLVRHERTSAAAVAAGVALAEACGAIPELWTAADHDAAVAAVSHLPQLVSSALAASLDDVDRDLFELAGSGLRDTTRLAGSPPGMWADICNSNASALVPRLRRMRLLLEEVEVALDSVVAASATPVASAGTQAAAPGSERRQEGAARATVTSLVSTGNRVHRRLPQKRWSRLGTEVSYGYVEVMVPDQPRALVDILRALADASVNVEDIKVDHVPDQPLGLVELTVLLAEVEHAVTSLRKAGFSSSGRSDRGD